ncbi:hypothetical protein BDV23DRAFT_178972 [Aspergillus alliaceus]|uniref:Voltage-gated hydrogen channel 1 n=1 Tax=Petromyces alliaceus TaxID=209559 RepID=A0A5N7CL69_PETAA|nr:hypothetical protein BDV23DRAFT_178972 [Aspergillus alliaceus]
MSICKRPVLYRQANGILSYLSSKFHVFDSLVIVVAFGIDVALHGLVEELGSLVVVLRLWRVFKVIEEIESVNHGTLEEYEHEIERLRQENTHLRQRLNAPTEPYRLKRGS